MNGQSDGLQNPGGRIGKEVEVLEETQYAEVDQKGASQNDFSNP